MHVANAANHLRVYVVHFAWSSRRCPKIPRTTMSVSATLFWDEVLFRFTKSSLALFLRCAIGYHSLAYEVPESHGR